GGVIGGVIKADLSDRAFQEGAALPPVRAVGDIKPPALVKRVEPAYPDIARANRNKGTVILEIVTDVYGKVISAKVLRSVSNLDQAAIDAVKQWIYKPLLVEGKPRSCIFTVTVVFELR
ncbi:MAG: energy transducer TonB, partial [Candidatus Aminicenantes bacterium]|nr:energy transducer TonB [Candidatus Aminicenantes bacterium]